MSKNSRLTADARAYVADHPGTSHAEAVRLVRHQHGQPTLTPAQQLDEDMIALAGRGALHERRAESNRWLRRRRKDLIGGTLPLPALRRMEVAMPGWRSLLADDLDEGHYLRAEASPPWWRHDYLLLVRDGTLSTAGRAAEKWLEEFRKDEEKRVTNESADIIHRVFPELASFTVWEIDHVRRPDRAAVFDAVLGTSEADFLRVQPLKMWNLKRILTAHREAPEFSTESLRNIASWQETHLHWRRKREPERPEAALLDEYVPGWREPISRDFDRWGGGGFDPGFLNHVMEFYYRQEIDEHVTDAVHGFLLDGDRSGSNRWLKRMRALASQGHLPVEDEALLDKYIPAWRTKPAATIDKVWREATAALADSSRRQMTNRDECFVYLIEHHGVTIKNPEATEWAVDIVRDLAAGIAPEGMANRLDQCPGWDTWTGSEWRPPKPKGYYRRYYDGEDMEDNWRGWSGELEPQDDPYR